MIFRKLFAMLQFGSVRLSVRKCPVCGLSPFVRFGEDETAVRCLRCLATPVHLALVEAVEGNLPRLQRRSAYELSSRSPLLAYLRANFDVVTCSEYIKGIPGGTVADGIRCEDVQKLSFEDGSFDLCTSTEVFEHVPDDMAGFKEILRVLRPGGQFIFTVPLSGSKFTVERAALVDGKLNYFLEPAYHGDRFSGKGSVLVFRDYGLDICERLIAAGFSHASITASGRKYFGHSRAAVVAIK